VRTVAGALFLVPAILVTFMGEVRDGGMTTSSGLEWHYWIVFGEQLWEYQLRMMQVLLVGPGLYFLITGELVFWRRSVGWVREQFEPMDSE